MLAVLNASQLVTLSGPKRPRVGAQLRDIGIIVDGGLIVRDGRIAAVGPSHEIERALPRGAHVIDAERRVVTPGFVDAHTHLVFAGNRVGEFELRASGATYEEIAAAGGGIQSTMRLTRAASETELLQQARKHAEWLLQSGTTTAEVKSGYGLSLEDEVKILRVIHELNGESPIEFVPTFLGAHAVPPEFAGRKADYVQLVVNEMLPRVAGERLAQFCDIFCERGYFDASDARVILSAAKKLGLQLRMHVDQLTNSGGAVLAAELGATTADHLEHTESDGIAALRSAGVQPLLLPGSVLSLGKSRYPRAREMIDAGLAVVLATDFNPGSSPSPSMPLVVWLACTQMKMTVAEAITACTINAACSLRRAGEIGSVEPGKLANFVIHECTDYREIGYYAGVSLTHSVFIQGEQVFGA